jgi:hypothetical protein
MAGNPFGFERDLWEEATFRSIEDSNYIYAYVTFDENKLKGPQLSQDYNMQAQARIPFNQNEFVYMRLYTDKTDQIYDFSMTYCMHLNSNVDTPVKKKFPNASMVNIRADYGHGRSYPHMDVEVFVGKKKIVNQDVKQDHEFRSYESAISAVLMQVEKLSNPLIGAQYWLSPIGIFPERVKKLAELRDQYKISTSLCVISRAINFQLYENTRTTKSVNDAHFWSIVESQIQLIRDKEKELGGSLDVPEIHYSTEMSVLPFIFFVPENAKYSLKRYTSDGSEIKTEMEPLGIVWEKKSGNNFVRDLDPDEKK